MATHPNIGSSSKSPINEPNKDIFYEFLFFLLFHFFFYFYELWFAIDIVFRMVTTKEIDSNQNGEFGFFVFEKNYFST